ncbi:hypothetical protein [Labedaea rhizosphaerae]|uniref:Uncharacterized protein n=1 Tax=Labedaea rhizosphaerae TaxID=598644 RepID=A0A4R6S0C1_LABRH|nr:hypothetical protein [Labedaea rhizosphaerae]TDP92921.1 hypothetical protein EV186_107156 [Labedaea rhizosphaerae]
MPKKAIERDAAAVKAIKYGLFARWSDWRCAGKDAKCGMPELLVPTGGAQEPPFITVEDTSHPSRPALAWATARTVQLGQLGRGMAELAWARFQEGVAEDRIRLERVRADHTSAVTRVETATKELADLTAPSEEELQQRANGEGETKIEVVTARRRQDFVKQQRTKESAVVNARAAVVAADQEAALVRERIQVRFEVVRTEAAIVEAYVRRRVASYLGRLIRKHPDGNRLGVLIRSGWQDKPAWTTWRDALGHTPESVHIEPENNEEAA